MNVSEAEIRLTGAGRVAQLVNTRALPGLHALRRAETGGEDRSHEQEWSTTNDVIHRMLLDGVCPPTLDARILLVRPRTGP